MKKILFAMSALAGALSLAAMAMPAQAAGTVILEGSDAIGFHSAFNGAAAAYRDQTFSALGGASSKKIAVVGSPSFSGPVTSGTHAIVTFGDLSMASATLSDYVAIYFLGNGGCCSSGPAYIGGRQTDLSAYVNGGGTVEIGDYDGNAGWDFLTGGTGNNAFVGGVSGALAGPSCSDGETITADGLANGFTQPAPIGCFTHQGYSMAHFAGLGFTKSFFNSDPAFAALNPGFGPFSTLLSNGNTITGGGNGVPEPASWALMLVGFGAVGSLLRSSRKRVALTA